MPRPIEKVFNWTQKGEDACSKTMNKALDISLRKLELRTKNKLKSHTIVRKYIPKFAVMARKNRFLNKETQREYHFALYDENKYLLLKRPMTLSKAKYLNFTLRDKGWYWKIIPF